RRHGEGAGREDRRQGAGQAESQGHQGVGDREEGGGIRQGQASVPRCGGLSGWRAFGQGAPEPPPACRGGRVRRRLPGRSNQQPLKEGAGMASATRERAGSANGRQAAATPRKLRRSSWLRVAPRTVREFSRDNLTDWAAALTYYGILAIFPAILALVSILGLIGSSATQPLI